MSGRHRSNASHSATCRCGMFHRIELCTRRPQHCRDEHRCERTVAQVLWHLPGPLTTPVGISSTPGLEIVTAMSQLTQTRRPECMDGVGLQRTSSDGHRRSGSIFSGPAAAAMDGERPPRTGRISLRSRRPQVRILPGAHLKTMSHLRRRGSDPDRSTPSVASVTRG